MGQALYRKYRSKSLDEIVGQEHITQTLRQAIDSNRLSHAYLFTGPRGVGKTSIARILAHEINQLPYDEEQNHIDIIEIDAASNRRIDEIRDLRDKVRVAPASARYKVYIIDEVHMLTREAFNALLKTLEEPPAHAIFILATTEAHKLPETIVSRTQRFIFRPIEPTVAVEHLAAIAKAEKIAIDTAALELIAVHGDGSFRDSISLLDQAGNHQGSIDAAMIRDMLGIPPDEAADELVRIVQSGDAGAIIRQLDTLYSQGYTPVTIANQLSSQLRRQLIEQKYTLPAEAAITLLDKLLGTAAAVNPERYLEIVLLGEAISQNLPAQAIQPVRSASPSSNATQPTATKTAIITTSKADSSQPKSEKTPSEVTDKAPKQTPKPTAEHGTNEELWKQVLEKLKNNTTLYTV